MTSMHLNFWVDLFIGYKRMINNGTPKQAGCSKKIFPEVK